ncbi:alpha-xylosidase [Gracilibacillus phocaeensis]|uniref:alpha-xylosidase n=1 Tax=Gracilibacillus phocaeensis TaxID=2042304 RepID=UPI00102FCAAC|nr:alpha-xylosidase [Gracilibacillus phocaeensis]
MKFTNGNWLVKEGYTIHFPKTIHEVKLEDQSVLLYAPCNWINHRGATLTGPLLTIRISTPVEEVFRIQAWHFAGGIEKGPHFPALSTGRPLVVEDYSDQLQLQTGSFILTLDKQSFALQFTRNGEVVTQIDGKGIAWIDGPRQESYMRGQLGLTVGENLYGLGERFTPFVKNGQTVECWNEDGGTSSEQSYKNIPFYVSSQGYGVFVNHPEKVSFELGSETVSRSQFSVTGEVLDYYVINGPTPKEVIQHYTVITGKPALPPAWSFGLWLSTSFTTNYDEETVTHFVDGMAERGIPLSVFHFDCFWMKEFEWCNFLWDRRHFPDPKDMLQRLKQKGLHISVWINPYIAQKSPLFEEGRKKGYLLTRSNGVVWQWDLWQAGMGIVDFTNPAARIWYQQHLKRLLDMGVDTFKTDFGERIPTDVIYHDGSDPLRMHNYYAYLYNQVVFELLQQEKGEQDAVVFARAATAGSQTFPVHWGGDCDSTYEAMAESLRGGLSLTTSGFGYWSHDIGGFENTATPDVFKRWTAFGLLSSHSRFHGSSSYRVPWQFDEEAVDVARYFTEWKNRLMPYLYGQAVINSQTGVPVMRSMLLEFPEDPICNYLDRQYMLGDSLLVAPIFRSDGYVSFYLPEGVWSHLFSGEQLTGGRWIEASFDYWSLPLYVKEGAILPIGACKEQPVYSYEHELTIKIYTLTEGEKSSRVIYNQTGQKIGQISVRNENGQYYIETNGLTGTYDVEMVGYKTITVDEGRSSIRVDI